MEQNFNIAEKVGQLEISVKFQCIVYTNLRATSRGVEWALRERVDSSIERSADTNKGLSLASLLRINIARSAAVLEIYK